MGLEDSISNAAYNAGIQHIVSGEAYSVRTLSGDLSMSFKDMKATVLSVTQGMVLAFFRKYSQTNRDFM